MKLIFDYTVIIEMHLNVWTIIVFHYNLMIYLAIRYIWFRYTMKRPKCRPVANTCKVDTVCCRGSWTPARSSDSSCRGNHFRRLCANAKVDSYIIQKMLKKKTLTNLPKLPVSPLAMPFCSVVFCSGVEKDTTINCFNNSWE